MTSGNITKDSTKEIAAETLCVLTHEFGNDFLKKIIILFLKYVT